jgi:hypothetical protein
MSEIKVNKLSPRTNCGTVQLGDSGDTITIPAGATITNNGTAAGFGATGAASWDTTVKTTGFTAVSGVGYFVNTTAGAISVNLPAGTAGDVVAIKDYANTFDTNAVTLVQNGSDKIGGSTVNAILTTEGLAITLVFIDSTQGWLVTDSGLQSESPTAQYVTATGGTITCSGDYRIHTFTGPGTFCVSCAGNPVGSTTVDYLVVAGGGGAARDRGGGGGAGGFRESPGTASGSYTVSPLGVSPAVALPVSVQPYTVTVGGGGTGGPTIPPTGCGGRGTNGSDSVFSTITATGGGTSGPGDSPSDARNGAAGGSGGGGGAGNCAGGTPGSGNTPPVSPPQGNNGGGSSGSGTTTDRLGGGGGGATAVGTNGVPGGNGNGGAGATTSISGSPTAYAGGGGGGRPSGTAGTGGAGGGGNGSNSGSAGSAGTTNTGGGGGGGGTDTSMGGAGGSGIVIIRYKFQN